MSDKQIKDFTEKTALTATDKLVLQTAGNVTQYIDGEGLMTFQNDTSSYNTLDTANATAANDSRMHFKRSRGTIASPTAVQSGDRLGGIYVTGCTGAGTYDGTPRRAVSLMATENWSVTNGGFRTAIFSRANGTISTPTEGLSVEQDASLLALPTYSKTVGATNRDLYIDNTGVIGYVSSIREAKKDIKEIASAPWIYDLKPKEYKYRKKDAEGKHLEDVEGDKQIGLLYDEVESICPEMCYYDVDDYGKKLPRGIDYKKLIVPLLIEIQAQKKTIDGLLKRVAKLEK